MGRAAKPWFRAGRGWYCEHEGRQVCLAHGEKAETEAEARQAFHRLKAGLGGQNGQDLAGADGLTVGELIARFLAHSQAEHKPSTFIWYRSVLRWFLEVRRYQTAISIRPIDVAEWARGRGNSPNFRRNNIAAIKAVFEWGRKMGLISTNPIADTPKPPMRTRQVIPIGEHVGRVLTATTGTPIGDLLVFLAETGCRLQDARRLTAADIRWEARLAILTEHKTDRATGRPKIIPLNEAAVALVTRLTTQWPSGPILRNTRGQPWTQSAVNQAVQTIRAKLGYGLEMTPHALRHRYTTDAVKVLPRSVVAALMGYSSTEMIDRVYDHTSTELAASATGLHDAAEAVRASRRTPPGHPTSPANDLSGNGSVAASPVAPPDGPLGSPPDRSARLRFSSRSDSAAIPASQSRRKPRAR